MSNDKHKEQMDWIMEWDGREISDGLKLKVFYDFIRNIVISTATFNRNGHDKRYTWRVDLYNTRISTGMDCEGNPIYERYFQTKEQVNKFMEMHIDMSRNAIKGVQS
jgi:hypothetical protein